MQRDMAAEASGDPTAGAIEWIMNDNRAVMCALAQLALEGRTPDSLGLDSNHAQRVVGLIEQKQPAFRIRELDRKVVVAALTACSLGWAVAEDWIVQASGLADVPIQDVRAQLDDVYETLMAAAQGACRETGEE